MNDDADLLHRFAEHGSEDAFRTLVEQHSSMVRGTALRVVGDASLADEITQATFLLLARKARQIKRGTVLAAWLYRTVRFTALQVLRAETRQQQRSHAFAEMNAASDSASVWSQIAPALDDALSRLRAADRDAMVLRFLDGKSFAQVAQALQITEAAAKMRVSRGLEKLRVTLARAGAVVPAGALLAALAEHSVSAAPAGFSSAVSAQVFGSAAVGDSVATHLTIDVLRAMAWLKVKVGAALASVVLLLAGGAIFQRATQRAHAAEDSIPSIAPGDLVYRVPRMDAAIIRPNLTFKSAGGLDLQADLYLPADATGTSRLPVIIFIPGDADAATMRVAKDWRFFRSYGRLAAASGCAGIVANHRSSEGYTQLPEVRRDLEELIEYVRANAAALSVDKDRLCLWFFSASGPHLSVAMGPRAEFVKCLVAYYPVLAPPPTALDAAAALEFSAIEQLKQHAPQVPPMLLAKAGRDSRSLNRLIDDFREQAEALRLPLEFLEHRTGRHAFDIRDHDDTSRTILHKTMAFVRERLGVILTP